MEHIKLEAAKIEPICDNCDPDSQNKSQVYCKDCKIFLCKECDQTLHQMRAFQSHSKFSSNQGLVEKFRHCQSHKNGVFVIYCDSCKQFLCEDCQNEEYHTLHDLKSLIEWEKFFPNIENFGIKDIENIIKTISTNIQKVQTSQDKIDELFEKLFSELQNKKTVFLEFYKKEIERNEESLIFLENLKFIGPDILKDKFFIRYTQSLNSRSNIFNEYSAINVKAIVEETQKINQTGQKLLNTERFFFQAGAVFIESQHMSNNQLNLLNDSKTVRNLNAGSWLACSIKTRLNKCNFKIESTRNSQIMIGITESNNIESKNTTSHPFQGVQFSHPSMTNQTLQTNLSAKPFQVIDYNIFQKMNSCSYSGSGSGTLYNNSNINKGQNFGPFGITNSNINLSEGYITGDTISIEFERTTKNTCFSKNGKLICQMKMDYLQDPCFFVELFDCYDSITIS